MTWTLSNLAEVCDDKCRVLVLSNPHNPAGLCWTEDTLRRLADFCYEHNIIVISDEIHSDMALFGNVIFRLPVCQSVQHKSVSPLQHQQRPSIWQGIVSSFAIVPNEELRNRFYGWLKANELDEPTLFAPIATIAAYRKGEEWRKQMLAYVEENVRFVEDFCREHYSRYSSTPSAGKFPCLVGLSWIGIEA